MNPQRSELTEEGKDLQDGTVQPDHAVQGPEILEEIEIEDLVVDGICGVY